MCSAASRASAPRRPLARPPSPPPLVTGAPHLHTPHPTPHTHIHSVTGASLLCSADFLSSRPTADGGPTPCSSSVLFAPTGPPCPRPCAPSCRPDSSASSLHTLTLIPPPITSYHLHLPPPSSLHPPVGLRPPLNTLALPSTPLNFSPPHHILPTRPGPPAPPAAARASTPPNTAQRTPQPHAARLSVPTWQVPAPLFLDPSALLLSRHGPLMLQDTPRGWQLPRRGRCKGGSKAGKGSGPAQCWQVRTASGRRCGALELLCSPVQQPSTYLCDALPAVLLSDLLQVGGPGVALRCGAAGAHRHKVVLQSAGSALLRCCRSPLQVLCQGCVPHPAWL